LKEFSFVKKYAAILLLILTQAPASTLADSLPWRAEAMTEVPPFMGEPATPIVSKQFHQGEYYSQVKGEMALFTVRLPKYFDATKPYDVLIFLGGGENSMYQLIWETDELDSELNDNSIYRNLIFASPYGAKYSLFGKTKTFDGPSFIVEFRNYIASQIKTTGRFLALGHSSGSIAPLDMALNHPDLFTAAVSVSPCFIPWPIFHLVDHRAEIDDFVQKYTQDYSTDRLIRVYNGVVGGVFGTEDNWNVFDPYQQLRSKTPQIPFLILGGAKDSLGYWKWGQDFVNYAKTLGVTIPISIDPNRDHEVGLGIREAVLFFQKN
jgi:pimeloyl-ACP methyl ester carboxylesterase